MPRYLILIAALLMPVCAVAAEVSQLTISGNGTANIEPNEASISLGVITRDKQCAVALKANSTAMVNLHTALEQFKVAAKDIETVNFSVNENERRQQDGTVIRDGFVVSNIVRITVRELGSFGKILDAAVSGGTNQVHGIAFGATQTTKLMDEARANAVDDAKRKAEVIATRLGQRLVRVVAVHEGHAPTYGRVMSLASTRSTDTPISGGSLDLTATVNVVWEIAPLTPHDRDPIADRVHPDTKNTLVPDPKK